MGWCSNLTVAPCNTRRSSRGRRRDLTSSPARFTLRLVWSLGCFSEFKCSYKTCGRPPYQQIIPERPTGRLCQKLDKGTPSLPPFLQQCGECIMTAENSAVESLQTQLEDQNTHYSYDLYCLSESTRTRLDPGGKETTRRLQHSHMQQHTCPNALDHNSPNRSALPKSWSCGSVSMTSDTVAWTTAAGLRAIVGEGAA